MKALLFGLLLALSFPLNAQNVRTYIPPQAFDYRDTIAKELETYFPQLHERNYVPALIEHESCITLKHKRCWSATSRLKTAREEGAGLGQLTRAYTSDGGLRFDSLNEMRRKYKDALEEASWDTIYQRPDVQIRMIVLMLRDNWNAFADVKEPDWRMAFMDGSYNGGVGNIRKERRQCSLTKGCDHRQWFGHVENHCVRSKKPLYGGRSACDIGKHHVSDVIKTRLPKYQSQYKL